MTNCKHYSVDLGFFRNGDWGCLRCEKVIQAHEIILPAPSKLRSLALFMVGLVGWILFGAALYFMFRPLL